MISKELKKTRIGLWVKALRSGKYKQCVGKLKKKTGYCCLGVACMIYHEETGKGEFVRGPLGYDYQIEREINDCTMPAPVHNWFGLKNDNPNLKGTMNTVHANDEKRLTFKQIADLLEARYLR